MDLSFQKRIAAEVLKCSPKRVYFFPEALDRIKEAMTKQDIRELIKEGMIIKVQKKGVSRARARENHEKRKKGRRRGYGSRKGKASARQGGKKRVWINKVRAQRRFVKELKLKKIIPDELYRKLYRLIKGGFFRSRRHIEIYLKDLGILTKQQEKAIDVELERETKHEETNLSESKVKKSKKDEREKDENRKKEVKEKSKKSSKKSKESKKESKDVNKEK